MNIGKFWEMLCGDVFGGAFDMTLILLVKHHAAMCQMFVMTCFTSDRFFVGS